MTREDPLRFWRGCLFGVAFEAVIAFAIWLVLR